MLLGIDIGNTNIVSGVFAHRVLKAHWRIVTDPRKTADEYGALFLSLLNNADIDAKQISGVILASVVPALTGTFESMVSSHFKQNAMIVSPDMDSGLKLCYKNPTEIGSDRIANAAAAYERFKANLIIVDFGTATTFCAITKAGDYLGGVIAPGLGISADALFSRTAKLPQVEFIRPKTVIGQDTGSSIQSGLLYGYVGLVDSIVHRIELELGYKSTVVATGGLSAIIARETQTIQEVLPFLTLEGLELLYRRNVNR